MGDIKQTIPRAIAIALCAALSLASPVRAQQTSERLVIYGCDARDFPKVTCVASPLDNGGVPISGLSGDAFTVDADGATVQPVQVSEASDPNASTSTLLLVDMSRSINGKALENLRLAVQAALRDKPIGESVGLIALTGKIDTASSSDPNAIKLDAEKESTFSTDANGAVVNKVFALRPQRGTPLHDALSKAITMVRNQPYGARAIVVLTDGFDVNSSIESIDTVIAYANREGIAVYTFGLGQTRDDEKLKRLSTNTGGEFKPAGSPSELAGNYRAIQERLKTRYTLAFELPAGPRGERKLTIGVKLPNGTTATADTTVSPSAPTVPIVESIVVRSGGKQVTVEAVPAGQVEIEPVIYAQAISRVEYQLDGGEPFVTREQPFKFAFDAGAFKPGSKHAVVVRAYGADGDETSARPQSFSVTMADAAAPPPTATVPVPTATPAPPPRPSLLGQPALLAALGVGLLLLLGLVGLLIFVLARRRRATPGPLTEVIASPYSSQTGTQMSTTFGGTTVEPTNDTTSRQTAASVNEAAGNDITRIITFEAPPESAKTQVLQVALAVLEVASGTTKGDRVPLGLQTKPTVVIGREVDPANGDLKIASAFVSRKHAEIRTGEGGVLKLIDLESSSGTKVNGVRLSPNVETDIKIGDEIVIADVQLKVVA
jgi:hypothetical protein